jgi:2-keto-4-pentenoate hydratase/2-oxohepta-3-ene-1,7-dioic acid hydratase in catechol pathway
MPLIRFSHKGVNRLGALSGDTIAPLGLDDDPARGVAAVLALDPTARASLLRDALSSPTVVALADVTVLAPVPRPQKILAVGLNYADHIAEAGLPVPKVPTIFAKYPNTITGPYDPIERPLVSDKLDYEGELAVVIGQRARHVAAERAGEVIGGYCVLDDVTVRDWQQATPQWTIGKSFDTHAPTGPWVTLPDEVDVSDLAIETRVNGELRQSSSTRQLVLSPAAIIAHVSQAITLEPGDIIATGTPGGVGFLMNPPRYLVPGDEVRVRIEGLGELINHVIDEPGAEASAPALAGTTAQ